MANQTDSGPVCTTTHPAWCDPRRCDAEYSGPGLSWINHISQPRWLDLFDARWELRLEWDEHQPPKVVTFVESKVVDQFVTAYVDAPTELDALISALLELRGRYAERELP